MNNPDQRIEESMRRLRDKFYLIGKDKYTRMRILLDFRSEDLEAFLKSELQQVADAEYKRGSEDAGKGWKLKVNAVRKEEREGFIMRLRGISMIHPAQKDEAIRFTISELAKPKGEGK